MPPLFIPPRDPSDVHRLSPNPGCGIMAAMATPEKTSSSRVFRLLLPAVAILAGAAALLLLRSGAPDSRKIELPREARNVILITIDTLRADHVGAWGAGRASTPALDALAAEGVRFSHCVTQAPLTLPAHTSLLSATYPFYHRVRDNGGFRVPEKLPLLSQALKAEGYATAAFIGAYVLHGKWGLNRGFDHYSDRFDRVRDERLKLDADKPAAEVLADAQRWLEGQPDDQPLFAWIHLYDPHFPYTPPEPFAARHPKDPYRGEVEYTDSELGRFVAALKAAGLFERTLLVVAADHGEGLDDHGEQQHGYFLYETTVHVPLIFRLPGARRPVVVPQTVQLVDVAPTVLDLLGVAAPAAWQGRSLRRLMAGETDDAFGFAYSETWYPRLHFGWAPLQAFYEGRSKYVLAPQEELYDLEADPGETRNRANREPERRSRLRARGLALVSRLSRGALVPGPAALTADDRRRLGALGYLTGAAQATPQGPLADPKEKLGDYAAFGRAVSLLGLEKWAEALAAARAVVAGNPEFADAWSLIGSALRGLGRHEEALAAHRRAIALKPDDSFLRHDEVRALQALGRLDEAAAAAEHALQLAPDDAALRVGLGEIRLQQNRRPEALQELRRALAADASAQLPLTRVVTQLVGRREFGDARLLLGEMLVRNPRAASGHYLLGWIEESQGRLQEAVTAYRRALELDPGRYEAAVSLANLLKQAGQLEEAARCYRQALQANDGLKMARFHLADIMRLKGEDLPAAVELCLKGIAIPPGDRETLFGYFVLTNLYTALGDPASAERYTWEGEKLIAGLERR